LTAGLYKGQLPDEIARLEEAFELAVATEPLRKKLKDGSLTPAETESLNKADKAAAGIIHVDDFSVEELFPQKTA
jgi:hypothetical protein